MSERGSREGRIIGGADNVQAFGTPGAGSKSRKRLMIRVDERGELAQTAEREERTY
jgi:hypothetical protein